MRRVKYDNYGERVIPTSPIRLKSVGDPKLWTSKPIGYDTYNYLKKYGYSEEKVNNMIQNGAVKVYKGAELKFDKLESSSAVQTTNLSTPREHKESQKYELVMS